MSLDEASTAILSHGQDKAKSFFPSPALLVHSFSPFDFLQDLIAHDSSGCLHSAVCQDLSSSPVSANKSLCLWTDGQ
eukprot:919412-Pelagomonas_calceolata.AAC.5